MITQQTELSHTSIDCNLLSDGNEGRGLMFVQILSLNHRKSTLTDQKKWKHPTGINGYENQYD